MINMLHRVSIVVLGILIVIQLDLFSISKKYESEILLLKFV